MAVLLGKYLMSAGHVFYQHLHPMQELDCGLKKWPNYWNLVKVMLRYWQEENRLMGWIPMLKGMADINSVTGLAS